MSIYLDYNASAPLDPRVLEEMVEIYRNFAGNADSRTHLYGERARSVVEEARKQAAALLGTAPEEVFFTSGSTESDNIAIQGLEAYGREQGKTHIVTTSIEHKAILETVKAMGLRGFSIDVVDPDRSGRVDADRLLERVGEQTLLVSVMHVNNETGVIQPVRELGEELVRRGIFFHVDATQSCGKLVEELRALPYHMLSFSAHKLRGPQGIGGLVLRKTAGRRPPVRAILYGGQQERGLRPGTVPVALAGGCGRACELARLEYRENEAKTRAVKEALLALLEESGVTYSLNGDQRYCVSNTLNLCLHGVSSEALMIAARQNCSVSNGSACTSKSYAPSYVLIAMGIPVEQIEQSIRVSWGPDTDLAEFAREFSALLAIAKGLSL